MIELLKKINLWLINKRIKNNWKLRETMINTLGRAEYTLSKIQLKMAIDDERGKPECKTLKKHFKIIEKIIKDTPNKIESCENLLTILQGRKDESR